MNKSVLIAAAVAVLLVAEVLGCVVPSKDYVPKILSPVPSQYLRPSDLPTAFSWCKHPDGNNYCSYVRNQNGIQFCGSCWAFAGLGALSDRVSIARKGQWPEFDLSPQHVLNCGQSAGSCKGGDVGKLYEWLGNTGAVDDTCQMYEGKDGSCSAINTCRDCGMGKGCWAVAEGKFTRYLAQEHGNVAGEDNMLTELSRGPIACYINAAPSFINYSGGIITDLKSDAGLHAVVLVGWDVAADGTKYWIGRNSMGSFWGETGYFRIIRGVNALSIESSCFFAVPAWK